MDTGHQNGVMQTKHDHAVQTYSSREEVVCCSKQGKLMLGREVEGDFEKACALEVYRKCRHILSNCSET